MHFMKYLNFLKATDFNFFKLYLNKVFANVFIIYTTKIKPKTTCKNSFHYTYYQYENDI